MSSLVIATISSPVWQPGRDLKREILVVWHKAAFGAAFYTVKTETVGLTGDQVTGEQHGGEFESFERAMHEAVKVYGEFRREYEGQIGKWHEDMKVSAGGAT